MKPRSVWFYWLILVPFGLLMLACMLIGEILFAGSHDR